MTLRAGALLGLPEGAPDPVFDVVTLRYVLLVLALVWAAAAAKARDLAILGAGLLFIGVAVGFWALALGRPYGLFVDPSITRTAAEVSVVSASGSRSETFLAGEPGGASVPVLLAGRGVPAALILLAPTLLPPLFLAAVAVLVYAAHPDRMLAPAAATLWLAFSTGDLETLRGMGIVPGVWSHPWSALAALALVLLAVFPPLATAWRVSLVVAAGLVLLRGPLLDVAPRHLGLARSCLLLTLDQGAWLPLAALGLWRGAWVAARALVAGGAVLVLAALAWPIDPWGAHAVYRLGLLLAACAPVMALARRLGEALVAIRPSFSRHGEARLGRAVLIAAFVPGSFVAWWNPLDLDPVAEASIYPLASRIAAVTRWIRTSTPRDAVFLAPPEYGADVAVLAGRRVLRAPTLREPVDYGRRQRVERQMLTGRGPSERRHFHNVRWVFLPPSGFPEHGIRGPEDLDGRPELALRYAADEFRIYELTP